MAKCFSRYECESDLHSRFHFIFFFIFTIISNNNCSNILPVCSLFMDDNDDDCNDGQTPTFDLDIFVNCKR
ncbi:hypothetical protein DERP_005675 [Dermatophagoides pteronyssinus]|uniref:Uncharacterized protein n=1 Tax=Dermatophagoides pteronyssinus TaxID=6956 RepID=A0ABQ8J9Y1_DERPT|nr:hypothetical protein DERP_005675 [Dermatophagoides pteronyssinus]